MFCTLKLFSSHNLYRLLKRSTERTHRLFPLHLPSINANLSTILTLLLHVSGYNFCKTETKISEYQNSVQLFAVYDNNYLVS